MVIDSRITHDCEKNPVALIIHNFVSAFFLNFDYANSKKFCFVQKKATCEVIYFSGLASSSGMRKYPHRLYQVGKTKIQNRSMNHCCYLANIQTVKEAVWEDVWSELRESAIGVIVNWSYCEAERAELYLVCESCSPFPCQSIGNREQSWELYRQCWTRCCLLHRERKRMNSSLIVGTRRSPKWEPGRLWCVLFNVHWMSNSWT